MPRKTFFILLALFAACASPRTAYQQQDYPRAFKLALADMKKGRGGEETLRILRQSLEQILAGQGAESRRLAETDNPGNWEQALSINYDLQEKIRDARVFLPDDFEKEAGALPGEAQQLRKRLHESYYRQGRLKMAQADSSGLKRYAQQAYTDFNKARKYAEAIPPELDSLTRLAQHKGILYYQVKANAIFDVAYNWEIGRIFKDLEGFSGGFLRVVYGEQPGNADCDIEISFSGLDIEIHEEKGESDYNREVILEYQTVTDTSGREREAPVYGTVEGYVTTITKTRTATWEANVNVTAMNPNCNLSGESFEAEFRSVIREIQVAGDERAIPEEYLDVDKEEFMDEEDMVEQLLEDLYGQITRAYF